MHRSTERFWKCFKQLPLEIQSRANQQFILLKSNSHHPSLHLKKIGKFWSIRISLDYRALSIKDGSDYIWVWIGTHDEYMRLVNKNP